MFINEVICYYKMNIQIILISSFIIDKQPHIINQENGTNNKVSNIMEDIDYR